MSSIPALTPLRECSKGETRCIARQEMGHYRNLIATALYKLHDTQSLKPETFLPALKHSIADHPLLNASVKDPEAVQPWMERPATIDLRNHIEIRDSVPISAQDDGTLEKWLQLLHDEPSPFRQGIPPWKIDVLPFESREGEGTICYVAYCYSHSHGDGKSGLAFHRSFLQGLRDGSSNESIDSFVIPSSDKPLLPYFAKAAKLYVSWSYLLGPFLYIYAPFIARILGIPNTFKLPDSPNSWFGKPYQYDPSNFHTVLQLLSIDNKTVSSVLRAGKWHGAKFTGILHQALVYALDKNLSTPEKRFDYISATPVDLRHLVPMYDEDTMTLCTTFMPEMFIPPASFFDKDGKLSQDVWDTARNTTNKLKEQASSLNNQPIGLMQYLGNVRQWLINQFGKARDATYEITNILVFNPEKPGAEINGSTEKATIQRIIFSQPANALGSAFSLNVVSLKGGDLVVTFTWQKGVLDLENRDEEEFMRAVISDVKDFFTKVTNE